MPLSTFQTVVRPNLPQGMPGDRASTNPVIGYVSSVNKLLAGAPVFVARFAWVDASGIVLNAGAGVPSGFVDNEFNALNTEFRGGYSYAIPVNLQVSLVTKMDTFAIPDNIVTDGQAVFASLTTGEVHGGTSGASIPGYIEVPGWKIRQSCAAGELTKLSAWEN